MASSSSKPKSFLEVPSSFFDGARVFSFADDGGSSPSYTIASPLTRSACVGVSSQQDSVPQGTLNRWACNTCSSLEFASLDEQRSHFKSDFHRFNIKRKLIGREPVSEVEFEVLVHGQHQRDDDMSSISGSDEEDNDSSDEDKNGDEGELSHPHAAKSACFNSISMVVQTSNEIATFWKCVVLRDHEKLCKDEVKSSFGGGGFVTEDALLQRLKNFTLREGPEEKSLWVIVLSRGGHFAGCVFDTKKGSILAHKTFHRYVVRAKAGGKQSTKDGTGRAPKSAGASLRRHNEASLQREIRELLASWKVHLDAASSIFVHAPSKNSHALFGGDDAPLSRSDPRVCTVPITTRRPTYKEARWIFNELMTITYQNVEPIDNVPNSSKSSSRKLLGGLGTDAEHICPLEGVKNAAEASSSCNSIPRESSDTTRSEITSVEVKLQNTATPLHDAAKSGDVNLVIKLLEKGANPCAKDDRGQTPYTLAKDKETRNTFRKFMALNLEMWDWHAANVPSALTDEMEAEQAMKQAEKDAKRKAKAKEQKKMRKEKQKARELAAAALNEKVIENSAQSKQELSSTSVQDAKKKAEAAEREKRALAAEKRIKALLNGSVTSSSISTNRQDGNCCSFCGVSLVGMTPFYRFSFQYCTTVCVQAHRLVLESGS